MAGVAQRGRVRYGEVRRGRQGKARRVPAGHGLVRTARQGMDSILQGNVDMATIQDTVGRLAIAKENVTMGQKHMSQVLQFFYERNREVEEAVFMFEPLSPPHEDLEAAIERLELAIHDLKIVKERVRDG